MKSKGPIIITINIKDTVYTSVWLKLPSTLAHGKVVDQTVEVTLSTDDKLTYMSSYKI
jgi:hypothetical protein